MEPAIRIEHVTKTFGDFVAVNDLSLAVPRGCIHGFLGQNGAGKTTTLRMITGIFMPDSGSISVLGERGAESIKQRLGYLPEEKGLYKKMRVGEIVTYFGRLKGMDKKAARSRAHELLERYGLGSRINSKCETLSKGMSQKVQVIGTLVHAPELIILDEPFSGLDPVNVEMLRDLIITLKREGKTVLFSTHVMEQAEQICDRIIMIHRGRKRLDGALSEVRSGGERGIRLDYDGDGSILRTLRGIRRVNDANKSAEIFLDPGVDPQEILRQLVGKLSIRRFDLSEPSLHEVFVRTVAEAEAELAAAAGSGVAA